MTESGQAPRRAGAFSDPDLLKRVISAVILAVLAVGTAWWGGWPFALLWGAAGAAILWEWLTIVRGHLPMTQKIGLLPVFLVLPATLFASLAFNGVPFAVMAMLLAAVLVFVLLAWWEPRDARERNWFMAGLVYAALAALGPVVLRQDAGIGFAAILWLFALVWGTDVGAYFCGRAIGGPKLWPRISPKKTWAGFIGGTVIGTVLAILIIKPFGLAAPWPLVLLTFLMAALSQGGDLLESSIKRHFNVKDSSNLIPGHGGVMDRLDGFLVAAGAAALFGTLRAGDVTRAASGLLVW